MKPSILKTGFVLAIASMAFCSFTIKEKPKATPKMSTTISEDEDAYSKVYAYINSSITSELRKALPKKNVKAMTFSRCPSGLNTDITNEDKISTDEMMYGTINDYVGCKREYVCDFKVCVNKKIALVKSKNDTEYVTVQAWLKQKNTKIKS